MAGEFCFLEDCRLKVVGEGWGMCGLVVVCVCVCVMYQGVIALVRGLSFIGHMGKGRGFKGVAG